MKTTYLFAAALAVITTLLLQSCEKWDSTVQNLEEATMYLNISSAMTKASGAGHGVQEDDNTVNTLEVFVFRTDGEDAGTLDVYKKFEGDALGDLTNLEVKSTTGAKSIYVIANSHKESFASIRLLSQFEDELSLLQKESARSFTMTGTADVTLTTVTPVSVTLQRLVARIGVGSIKTNFSGTPYEGTLLKNVKLYLLNVNGDKTYSANTAPASPLVLNLDAPVESDITGCVMTNMIYEELGSDVSEAAYTTKHYFYCYENMIAAESGNNYFTRLVLQADLGGKTYYYPINVNREEHGYVAENGHKGVKRNTAYDFDIVISRPGSLDPNEPVQYGALQVTMNVADWTIIPKASIIF